MKKHRPKQYKVREGFALDLGFRVNARQVLEATTLTNGILSDLPASLYRSIDYKTTSSVIGAVFCESLADKAVGGIVNPIEKGHPDIVPIVARTATEAELRNYPRGLEVKCTVGNIETGANLRAGESRLSKLTGLTWQAHHREVRKLMGISWDFAEQRESFSYPAITGIFYSDCLVTDDWGKISGTTGRNTKVTGMRSSGKKKMGAGWVLLLDSPGYLDAFERLMGVRLA